jgi:hypothetical protein
LFLQTTDDNSQEVKIPNKEIRRESLKEKSGFTFAELKVLIFLKTELMHL